MGGKSNTLYKGSHRRLTKMVCWVLFIAYAALLTWELFLGRYRSHSGSRLYNLIPLETISGYFTYFDSFGMKVVAMNLIGNLLAFIPLGFFVPLMFRRLNRLVDAISIAMLTSLGAEMIQFVFNVGRFDVDDILLNTLGGVLGFVLYKAVYRFVAVSGLSRWV